MSLDAPPIEARLSPTRRGLDDLPRDWPTSANGTFECPKCGNRSHALPAAASDDALNVASCLYSGTRIAAGRRVPRAWSQFGVNVAVGDEPVGRVRQ